ncbi:hypothetical protein PIB30_114949, partial [Stylosanthes scabra]|nr:hypothetical protein [Stylosanthes scabra]
ENRISSAEGIASDANSLPLIDFTESPPIILPPSVGLLSLYPELKASVLGSPKSVVQPELEPSYEPTLTMELDPVLYQ